MRVVDPANPIPKYLQISSWLRELVLSGRYRPGERLPSEMELARACRVNRNTVRHAVAELTSAGILSREKGKGTFVASPRPMALRHRLTRISSFRDDLRELGIREQTKILHQGLEEAADAVSKALFLGPGRRVVAVRRLRMGNGTPFIYEESYLPQEHFAALLEKDLTGSLYRILTDHFKVVLARSEQRLRAVNLRGHIAAILNLPPGAAGMFLEGVTYDENNMPVELLHSYYRGDKYVFEIELGGYPGFGKTVSEGEV